jgi:hypothetical protein
MVALRIWLRRCTAAKAFPALLAAGLVFVSSRSGWQYDWTGAFDWTAMMTILIVPATAGLVAYDRSRRLEPTLAALGQATVRRTSSLLSLVAASWAWATLSWLVAVVFAAGHVVAADGVGRIDHWTLILPPVAIAAGGCFGLLCGTVMPNLGGGPVAAVTTYVLGSFAGGFGLPRILTAGDSTGTRIGVEYNPRFASGMLLFHLTFAAACVIWALVIPQAAARAPARGTTAVTMALLVVLAATNLRAANLNHDMWLAIDEPYACVGTTTVVCGPRDATPLIRMAHRDVDKAIHRLSSSGIAWQRHYVYHAGSRPVPATSGLLSLQTEEIHHGHLSVDDIVSTLGLPRLCDAYFDDAPPETLMQDQGVVMAWLVDQLRHSPSPAPAPDKVQRAYQVLRECAPHEGAT